MKEIDRHTYGPWALVTGASSGIGEGFARQAAANGLNVVLVARREERLKELGAELTTRYGVEAHALPLDLADEGAFNAIVEGTDGLDIGLVISNAGAGNPGPFISLPHDKLREIVRLNVFAHLDLAHHFGKKLAERWGTVGSCLSPPWQRPAGCPAWQTTARPRPTCSTLAKPSTSNCARQAST